MLSTSDVAMSNLDAIKVIDLPGEGTGTRRAGDIIREAGEDSVFSTAVPAAGSEDAVRPIDVIRLPGQNAVVRTAKEALDKTWAALCLLAGANDWDLVPFPATPRNGPAAPAFDFATDFLLAELETQAGSVVVVDLGSSSGEERSLGLLTPEGGYVKPVDLPRIRRFATEIDGRWHAKRLRLNGFGIVGVSRKADVWLDVEVYAELLLKRINEAQGAS